MINPIQDKLIPLSHVPKLKWLQRENSTKRINVSTVYRWSQGSPTGCALETILMPWGKCTTEDAIRTFLKERNRPYYIPPPSRTQRAAIELAWEAKTVVAHLKKPAKAISGVDKIIINYQCYGLDTVSSRPQIELTLDSKGRTRVILNKTRNTTRPHAWNGLNHMAYFIARGIMIGVSRHCLTVQIGSKGCATYSFVKLRDALVKFIEKITQNKPREEVASLHVFCDTDEISVDDVSQAIQSGGPLNKSVTYFLSKNSDQLSGIAIGNVRKGICSLRVYDKQLKCRTFPRDLTSIRQRYAGTYIPRTRFEYHITSRLLRGLNIYTLKDLIENSEVLTAKLLKHYVFSSQPRKRGKPRQPDAEWIKFCADLNKWSANLNLRVSCNPIAELNFETRLLGQSKSVAGSILSMIQQSKQNGLSDEGAKCWICDLCNDALGQDGTGIILVDKDRLDGEPS